MKLHIRDYYEKESLQSVHWEDIGRNPCYDLDKLPSVGLKKEMANFTEFQSHKLLFVSLVSQRTLFHKLCRFLQEYGEDADSFLDKKEDMWYDN